MSDPRNVYTYSADLNLYHDVYEKYDLKLSTNAVHVELESEHFSTYQECVDDCNTLLDGMKDYFEKLSGVELIQGWEANPSRNTDPNLPHLTSPENWEPEEIIHIFLFSKEDGQITTKTTPVVAVSIRVDPFDAELLENSH